MFIFTHKSYELFILNIVKTSTVVLFSLKLKLILRLVLLNFAMTIKLWKKRIPGISNLINYFFEHPVLVKYLAKKIVRELDLE